MPETYAKTKSVKISVLDRLCKTRAKGVLPVGSNEACKASFLPTPDASTHTSRAAAKAG